MTATGNDFRTNHQQHMVQRNHWIGDFVPKDATDELDGHKQWWVPRAQPTVPFIPFNPLPYDLPRRNIPLGDFDKILENSGSKSLWRELSSESDNELVLILDLPGVKLDDLKLSYDNSSLIVEAYREDLKLSKVYEYQLSESFDPNSIQAILNLGVLKVSILKQENFQSRNIPVKGI